MLPYRAQALPDRMCLCCVGAHDRMCLCCVGAHQTDPWQPPAAKDGQVPKNERGNVEVPPFASALPGGCVHLRYRYMQPICRELGIDFAPALEGFELAGGRMVPKIEGVVVCEVRAVWGQCFCYVMAMYHQF